MNILVQSIIVAGLAIGVFFIASTWTSLAGYIILLYTFWPIYKLSPFIKVPDSPKIVRSSLKLSSSEINNIKKYKGMIAEYEARLSIVTTQDIAKRKDGFYQERNQKAIDFNEEWGQILEKINDLEEKIESIKQNPYDRIYKIESLIDDRYDVKKQKFIAKLYFILVAVLLFLDYSLLKYHYYPALLAIPLSYIFVFLYKDEEIDNSYVILILAKKDLDMNTEIIEKDYENNQNSAKQTECNEDPESFFDIILKNPGEKEVEVIKIVRALTKLTLEQARIIINGTSKPFMERVDGIKASEVKKKLEECGATVRLVKKRK